MLYFRGEFTASDQRGFRYVLLFWTDDGGDLTLETSDGKPVTRVKEGRYHLARHHRDVELTSNAPNAP